MYLSCAVVKEKVLVKDVRFEQRKTLLPLLCSSE